MLDFLALDRTVAAIRRSGNRRGDILDGTEHDPGGMLAHEGVRKTINGYTAAGDGRNGEAFAALFADHAVLEFAGFGPVPGFRSVGLAEIRARTATWNPQPEHDPSFALTRFIRHNLTTCRIALTSPDSASARTYFVVFTEIGPDHVGTYDDVLVRQDDRWLFSHRRIALDWRSAGSVFPPLPKP